MLAREIKEGGFTIIDIDFKRGVMVMNGVTWIVSTTTIKSLTSIS
jgi:hypothetical protein